MNTNYQKELDFAKTTAIEAGKAIMQFYGKKNDVTHKTPTQPLTEADLKANQIITSGIKKLFPDDGILSEEITETSDHPERLNKSRVWIIDPLDGTIEFINQNPEFVVSIGLIQDNKSVVGAIYNPVTEELFYGAKGHGCFYNNQPCKVSQNTNPSNLEMLVSQSEYNRGEWETFKDDFKLNITGSIAYKMALVSAGKSDGSFTLCGKSEWDVAAGFILVEEAGGIVTTATGEEILLNQKKPKLKSLLYCNKPIHSHLLQVIQSKNA